MVFKRKKVTENVPKNEENPPVSPVITGFVTLVTFSKMYLHLSMIFDSLWTFFFTFVLILFGITHRVLKRKKNKNMVASLRSLGSTTKIAVLFSFSGFSLYTLANETASILVLLFNYMYQIGILVILFYGGKKKS